MKDENVFGKIDKSSDALKQMAKDKDFAMVIVGQNSTSCVRTFFTHCSESVLKELLAEVMMAQKQILVALREHEKKREASE